MPSSIYTSRIGDMSPLRALHIEEQPGGDVIVRITSDGSLIEAGRDRNNDRVMSDVEFCLSGGRSHKTREALRAVAQAMREDAAEYPISLPPP